MPEVSLSLISVIIVSYRSRDDLARCLPTLYAQGVPTPEVIVVDNAPGDGTAAWLTVHYPQLTIITNPVNNGYAGGVNLGLEHATGDAVLVLNPDTELASGALGILHETLTAHPDALITPKLLNPDGTVNACGLVMHYTGITTCRGLGEPAANYQGLHPVPLISGAAFMARRELLLALGGFDDSYFMYLEDADLSLRARLCGYELLCAADAVITHHYTLGMNPQKFYYLERNRLLTLFKNYQAHTLKRILPPLLLTELATWAYALLRGPRYLAARARGYRQLWLERERWLAARKAVQHKRRRADAELLAESLALLPFDQLIGNRALARLLGCVTRPLYTLARPASPR